MTEHKKNFKERQAARLDQAIDILHARGASAVKEAIYMLIEAAERRGGEYRAIVKWCAGMFGEDESGHN